MSGFAEQRQQLRKALVGAGIPAEAAARIANILGNSVQEMTHAGRVTTDNTPAELRYVTSQARKLLFPNLDNRAADPDHRKQRVASSEEKPTAEPEPNVVIPIAPQQADAKFRVAAGNLTDVAGNGQASQVNVRNVVNARPAGGLPLTMLDAQANQLVGKAPRAAVNGNDGTARFDVQENNREVIWNLQMLNRADYDVVTNVQFVPGKGLEVTYKRIKAWDENREKIDLIPSVDEPVVTEIVQDKHGLRGERRILTALGSAGASRSYFNVYRIGKFTGGWAIGTSKEIEQVWPTSDEKPMVKNLTQNVANTEEEEKYVLFAMRTEDSVPPLPEDEEDPIPDATKNDLPSTNAPPATFDVNGNLVTASGLPTAEYYAIEIQHATECTAFSSLNGQLVSDLVGYDPDIPQALSHGIGGCLGWRSQAVTVITDAALTVSGLEFTRATLYVLGSVAADPVIIPITDCPPPTPPEGGGG